MRRITALLLHFWGADVSDRWSNGRSIRAPRSGWLPFHTTVHPRALSSSLPQSYRILWWQCQWQWSPSDGKGPQNSRPFLVHSVKRKKSEEAVAATAEPPLWVALLWGPRTMFILAQQSVPLVSICGPFQVYQAKRILNTRQTLSCAM